MSLYGIEDCLAMSEDGEWIAFPAEMTRGQVIAAVASDSDWWTVLHTFRVKAGHVFQGLGPEGEPGWYTECEETDADAIPAWIVKRRRP